MKKPNTYRLDDPNMPVAFLEQITADHWKQIQEVLKTVGVSERFVAMRYRVPRASLLTIAEGKEILAQAGNGVLKKAYDDWKRLSLFND